MMDESVKPSSVMPPPATPDPGAIGAVQRTSMLAAGREVRECMRVLEKTGLNLVGEVLKGQGEFVELEHYPRDDVYDAETHAQYYYHAHRPDEHGHFHTFMRPPGMPAGMRPIDYPQATDVWPAGDEALCHLAGISMDAWGRPIGLFATNRWVTAEAWYTASDAIRLLDRFRIDHAYPSWPVNRWIGAMVVLFRPHVEALLRHRDEVVAAWQAATPEVDVFEDRRLDLTGYFPIDIDGWIKALEEGER